MKQYINKANTIKVAIVAVLGGTAWFLTFAPMGRAIVFAVNNVSTVNDIATQQAQLLHGTKFAIAVPTQAPKAE